MLPHSSSLAPTAGAGRIVMPTLNAMETRRPAPLCLGTEWTIPPGHSARVPARPRGGVPQVPGGGSGTSGGAACSCPSSAPAAQHQAHSSLKIVDNQELLIVYNF